MSKRINQLKNKISKLTDPEDIMLVIMDTLKDTDLIPVVGKYYTFVYTARTEGITYDQHPLIACLEIHRWGFKGFNYHWNSAKNYSWLDTIGSLYIIEDDEINDMKSIRYAKYITK